MSMLIRLRQPQNACCFIVVTDAGNDMDVRLVHLKNNHTPIVWMLFGMLIVCSLLHLLNALVPMAEMSEETVATSTLLYGGTKSTSSPV